MSDKKTEDELEAELDREIDARLEDYLAQFKRAASHFFTQERALIGIKPAGRDGIRNMIKAHPLDWAVLRTGKRLLPPPVRTARSSS
jgi:hypothetical protein